MPRAPPLPTAPTELSPAGGEPGPIPPHAGGGRVLRLLVPGYGEGLGAALWLLFFARVINVFAFSSAFPFLAKYFATDRGLSASAVGAVYMVQGMCGALFQLVGGELADRVGRRAVIVWSLAVRAGLALGIGACVQAGAPVLAIIALMFLNALLAGVYMPAADALVIDHTTPESRIAAFAHQRVAINVGWALGPLVGGLVSGHTAFAAMFYVASPMILAGALVLSRLPEAAPVASARENPFAAVRSTLRLRPLRLHLLGALLTFVLAGQFIVTLSVDGASRLHLGARELGLVWTLNGLLVVFAQMPAARFVERLGTGTSLVLSSLVYAGGYAAIGFATGLGPLLGAVAVVTLGELLNGPSQQASMAERVPLEATGRALGLLGLTVMLGRSLGPFVGGLAHDAYGENPRLMWGMLGALGLAAALVYAHPDVRRPKAPSA